MNVSSHKTHASAHAISYFCIGDMRGTFGIFQYPQMPFTPAMRALFIKIFISEISHALPKLTLFFIASVAIGYKNNLRLISH